MKRPSASERGAVFFGDEKRNHDTLSRRPYSTWRTSATVVSANLVTLTGFPPFLFPFLRGSTLSCRWNDFYFYLDCWVSWELEGEQILIQFVRWNEVPRCLEYFLTTLKSLAILFFYYFCCWTFYWYFHFKSFNELCWNFFSLLCCDITEVLIWFERGGGWEK